MRSYDATHMRNDHITYVDDDTESLFTLLKLRTPVLLIGLALGIAISFFTSSFEEVISQNVRVAFFLPFIVYIADALGTQTQAIYTRDLKSGKAAFHTYLIKESAIGVILGTAFGIISGVVIYLWFRDEPLALSVGISIIITVSVAPLVSLLITEGMELLKIDPAAEAGPIATVAQDMLSVVIYGFISSAIILG